MDVVTIALIAGAGVAVAITVYMVFCEPVNIQVKEFEFAFPNLPPEFDGYSILHISDLHLKRLGRVEKRLMSLIREREVDTCVVTGDVTAQPRASDIFRRVCSVIKHRDPIYMTVGNSEHKPWLDSATLVEALSFDGLHMLINSSSVVCRGEGSIAVAGVDDPYSRLEDVNAAFRDIDPSTFIIFLTHCPSTTPQGIDHGADLVLSGHTHGGQVRIPLIGMLFTHMRANKQLNDGLYLPDDLRRILSIDPGNTVLFVNRGVGTSRLSIRFLCPPEIAYITLRRGAVS